MSRGERILWWVQFDRDGKPIKRLYREVPAQEREPDPDAPPQLGLFGSDTRAAK